jgi:hypothetical protein
VSQVAITGASGFIGRALSERLLAHGVDVVAFVRGDAPTAGRVVRWDPARGELDRTALRELGRLDAVVHLAGAGIADKRWSPARKDEILSSRTRSTELLARELVALDERPGVVISSSAIGFYGSRGDEILDEGSSQGAGYLAEVCHRWEQSANALDDADVPCVRLRTGIVLDAHGGALKKQLPLFRAGLGGRLGSGRQWMSVISLSDLLSLIEYLIDQRSSGPVNAVTPEPVTNDTFTRELAGALHRPAIAPVPPVALRAALGRELVDEALLASQRVVPTRALELGYAFEHPDVASAISAALTTAS